MRRLLFLLVLGYAAAQEPDGDKTARWLKALLPKAPAGEQNRALRQLGKARDKRFIAPLIDLLPFANTRQDFVAILETLGKLTGEKFAPEGNPWENCMVWYGAHSEWQPPPGYTAWKGELFGQRIDPRFRQFLYQGATATVRVEEVAWGGVRVDGIPALVNPRMIAAAQAGYLTDREPVFGVSLEGHHRAYPLRILDWHEMANDVVGGKPVALAYCTLCGAGILYHAQAGGMTFQFGSSGLLFRSNKLMYDRTTNTLWNHLTGEPVIGKLAGNPIKLAVLPLVLTSWSQWRRRHPDTRVLDVNTGHMRRYEVGATYGAYFASPHLMFPVWRQSRALPNKARIFALQIEGVAKAYPLDELNRAGGVVNDTLGGRSLVVVYGDAVGKVSLPPTWREALKKLGGPHAGIELANDLSLAAALAALNGQPRLSAEMTAEVLLAMPAEARLTLLNTRTSYDKTGSPPPPGWFSPNLRDEVGQRGLIGETRAYQRGRHRFRGGAAAEVLIDENERPWRVTEEALLALDGERLARLPGHLAYWFGWFSFFPRTQVYSSQNAAHSP